MLNGLATCGLCGGGMQLRTGKSGAYRYLTCAKQANMGAAVCSGQSIRMDHLDEQVVSILLNEVLAPQRLAKLCETVEAQSAELDSQLAADAERIRRAISDATRRITNLLSLAADDRSLHDDDSFRGQLANLRRQKEEQAAQLRMAEARRAAQKVELTPERIAIFEKRVRHLLESFDPHVRKLWVRHFVAEVVVYPDHIRIIGPNDQIVRDLNTVRDDELLVVPSFAREWRTRHDSNV